MSTDVYVPLFMINSQLDKTTYGVSTRSNYSKQFAKHRNELLRESDSLRLDDQGNELWRISIRLAALNNVDYGRFVNDLKTVVEPTLAAYSWRNKLVQHVQRRQGEASLSRGRLLVIGTPPQVRDGEVELGIELLDENNDINQTLLFANTFRDLLENQGYEQMQQGKFPAKTYLWLAPDKIAKLEKNAWLDLVKRFDYVLVSEPELDLDLQSIESVLGDPQQQLLVTDDYRFVIDSKKKSSCGRVADGF